MKDQRIKIILLALLPVVLFAVLVQARYQATLQYTYQLLCTAIQDEDLAEIQRLTTHQGLWDLKKPFQAPMLLRTLRRDLANAPVKEVEVDEGSDDAIISIRAIYVHDPPKWENSYILMFSRTPKGWKLVGVSPGYGVYPKDWKL